ncbi:MAG: class I SAM-dependent DNA methyltransferase [Solirubrobacteraceae bacterium]
MDAAPGSLSAAWETRAAEWARWARSPGQDVYFSELNWPAFCAIVPGAGRRTLDVGCGEGRVGRLLADAGHRLAGVDSSPTLVALAREAGGYEEIVCASATALPWPPAIFDLAVAFMSLQDIDDPVAAIGELGRVIVPGGRLCIAIVHPLNRPPEHLDGYFDEHRVSLAVERNGIAMTFEGFDRPLETYTSALGDAGFVIEARREPRPTAHSLLAPARSRPFFLHLRCRREDG